MKRNIVYFGRRDFGYSIPCLDDEQSCDSCSNNRDCTFLGNISPNFLDTDCIVELNILAAVYKAHYRGFHCVQLAKRVDFRFAEKMGWD